MSDRILKLDGPPSRRNIQTIKPSAFDDENKSKGGRKGLRPSESLDTFNSGKVVTMNVKDYIHAKDHQEGCTGCVTCMKSKL